MIIIKAFDIAMFQIGVLLALNIFSASGFLNAPNCGQPTAEPCISGLYNIADVSNLNTNVQGVGFAPQENEVLGYLELSISAFGLLIRSIIAIIKIFAYNTILLPMFLSDIGIPVDSPAGIFLWIGTWIAYGIGLAQYKGRSTLQGTE